MKVCIPLLLAILHSSSIPSHADLLPPKQDSSSRNGKLTQALGKATTLSVSATRKAYVSFETSALPSDISAEDIANARLRIFFPAVKKAGALAIHTVSEGWNESEASAEPIITSIPTAVVLLEAVGAKRFVEADVTAAVRAWIIDPDSNHGFALVANGATNLLVGAKEGSGSGYPCELEVQIDRVDSSPITGAELSPDLTLAGTTSGTFSGNGAALTISGYTLGTLLDGAATAIQPQINALTSSLDEAKSSVSDLESDKVNKSGDIMTGGLTLPANGLLVGSNQLVISDGKVGIGTVPANAALEVRGDVKLGSGGQLFAPAAGENLRIVRGTIRLDANGAYSIVAGAGFSVTRPSESVFEVTFTTPFSVPPTVTVSGTLPGPQTYGTIIYSRSVSGNGTTLIAGASFHIAENTPALLHFIALGAR